LKELMADDVLAARDFSNLRAVCGHRYSVAT
jgi:hypothetical protein